MDRLQRTDDNMLTLQNVFEGCPRIQRIGLFLATLELVRLRKIVVLQEDLLTDVKIELSPESPDEPEPEPQPQMPGATS